MKKEWLLLFTLLPGLFATSCKSDEYFEGYKGDTNMTQQLPVDWSQAANKSAGILTTNFLPAGNTLFGKQLQWDSTQENPTETFVDYETGEMKLTSQMEGVKVLLRNYLRSGDNNTLTVAQNILGEIKDNLDTDNYDEVAQYADILLLSYEATNDAATWTELKNIFAEIETVTEVTETGQTTGEGEEGEGSETVVSGYTNGTNGVPASATDAKRTAKGNGLAVMITAKMAEIAAANGEANAETYKNFASNVMNFCLGRMYGDAGIVYESLTQDASGIWTADQTYRYYNQGYMIGAIVAYTQATGNDELVEGAKTIARHQLTGGYMHSNLPVFMPNYDSGAYLGTIDRTLLLSRSIFCEYLKDLVDLTGENSYYLCITNNAETMWAYGQENENCLWGARWYEPAFAGEYASSNSLDDPMAPYIVISLESQIAGTSMAETKASL